MQNTAKYMEVGRNTKWKYIMRTIEPRKILIRPLRQSIIPRQHMHDSFMISIAYNYIMISKLGKILTYNVRKHVDDLK